MSLLLITRALLSGALIVIISELAKRNNFAAAITHSLPLISVTALVWLYHDNKDLGLIARHSESTFWFVLPTLPLFLIIPWLLRHGFGFWTALASASGITVGLYLITARLLTLNGYKF